MEPELLNWANYSIKPMENVIRRIIYIFYLLCTLYACFYTLFTLEAVIQDAENAVPGFTCQEGFNEERAFIDYNKKITYRNGDFNCFCEKKSIDEGSDIAK